MEDLKKVDDLVFNANDMLDFANEWCTEFEISIKDVKDFRKMRDRQKALGEFLKDYDKKHNINL